MLKSTAYTYDTMFLFGWGGKKQRKKTSKSFYLQFWSDSLKSFGLWFYPFSCGVIIFSLFEETRFHKDSLTLNSMGIWLLQSEKVCAKFLLEPKKSMSRSKCSVCHFDEGETVTDWCKYWIRILCHLCLLFAIVFELSNVDFPLHNHITYRIANV